ncbi:MAG: ImmA/IrrE family metallo-endopeptidase [Oribacterium sp.]|nr:ImmA/IrrE family metallo-endopeptidase [Oribacterium sp.]
MNKKYWVPQVAIRMVKMPPLISKEPMNTSQAAIRIMNDTLKEFDREALVVVNLKNDLKPINVNFVSMGTLNASLAHPREILKSSILSNAACIMLFHNHPSGDLSPSSDDVAVTDQLQKACQIMGIPILDHIIVGADDQYYSFHEKKLMDIPAPEFEKDIEKFEWKGAEVAEQKPKYDSKKTAEDRKQEMKEITDRLEKGVSEIFQSEKYQKFLDTMSKFPHYSLNNNLLIMMQKPDATLCQSYTGWKQMGRFVKKGEKGIRILAPSPYKIEREQNKLDEKGITVLDKDGEPVKETVQINVTAFKPVSTFDISQTEGEPIPTIGVDELAGNVDGYAKLFAAIKEASPVPISFENIKGDSKGYFQTAENRIAIQKGMSEIQNIKTAIHEIAHAKLHNMEIQKNREDGGQSRSSKEVEAESVAYTVCQHFGIDTSDYSFAYVAGWSQGKEMPELKESLNTIRTAASELISAIEEKTVELIEEKKQTSELKQDVQIKEDLGHEENKADNEKDVPGKESIRKKLKENEKAVSKKKSKAKNNREESR